MSAETIEVAMPDGVAEAYVSRPDGSGDHPPVLLYIDAFGLRPCIEEMADRIAAWGCVVMAPNVFYRDGTAADVAPTADLRVPENREAYVPAAMERVKAHTPDQAAADREAYLDTLLGLPGVRGPAGVTGYCMGGRLAIRAAAGRPDDVAAVGIFHTGGLVTDADDSPHRLLAAMRAEVLAGHADHDRSNPPEAIAAFDAALEAAGLSYATAVYPGAAHGYTMPDTSSYDEAAAERHFTELEALFGRVLG